MLVRWAVNNCRDCGKEIDHRSLRCGSCACKERFQDPTRHPSSKDFRKVGKQVCLMSTNKCVICGWTGPCDKHRLEKKNGYIVLNVVSLCPNCHRLLHRGLLEVSTNLQIVARHQDSR